MKRTLLASAALLLAATALPAQQPVRYRLETRSVTSSESPGMKQKMEKMAAAAGEDLGAAGGLGAANEMTASMLALLTLTRRDSAGGVVWHAVVDSFVNDQGKMGETLRKLGIGGEPVNLVGASFDSYVKDSTFSPLNRKEGKEGTLLMTLTSALMPALITKTPLSKGQTVRDSSFAQQTLPAQGALVQMRTNSKSERSAPDEMTEVETNRTESQMDLGATKGTNLTIIVETRKRVLAADHTVASHTVSTSSTVVMLVPVSGATLTSAVETKSVVRIP